FHKRPKYYKAGGNGARNYGFDISKGEYIQWFDSDDVMLVSFLEDRINLFDEKTLLVICSYYFANNDLKDIRRKAIHLKTNLLKDYIIGNFSVLTPSVLFKKSFLEKFNKVFDPQIERSQETEFFIRIFKLIKNKDFKYTNKPLFLYRLHSESKSGQSKNQYVSSFSQSKMITQKRLYNVALEIKDGDLRKIAYEQIIFVLFQSIKNRDKEIYNIFQKRFLDKTTKEFNYLKKTEIKILYKLMFLFRKTPKLVEKRWMNFIDQ